MASESNEIGDIVKKCKILLLDIEGTTTSISFVKDQLFPYAKANVKEFLENQWEEDSVKKAVAALRKLALEDEEQKVEGVVTIPGEDAAKEEQIEGLVKSVKWQMSVDRKAGPLKQLQGLIWKKGYDNGDIKGHVYDDVAPALALWKASEGQKVYIYSSGSVQAQKLLFSCSAAGDLLPHIEGHFDTAVGGKQEAASYAAIAEQIACKPDEILFLTDIPKEAEAARAAGLQAALVSREGNAPLSAAAAAFPVLRSFEQLAVSNKRKPEPQEQEVPAKIPKTDIEADVKTAAEKVVSETVSETISKPSAPEAVAASEVITEEAVKPEEPEKMEVEEDIPVNEAAAVTEQPKDAATEADKTAVRIETVIEEVTTSNDANDAPVCDLNPIITEESVKKTDKNETEKMETESEQNGTVETAVEPKELPQESSEEQSPPVAEGTPPSVVIQEVTNDQEIACAGIEMVDDLVPVVEEPANVEMEDLNNVADVLDKECDEILLKVHDVTNLDNIPVKPLLNSIAEEDIEAENGENTNDIVDSILDSEMELGVKPCEDIVINIVQEISTEKVDTTEIIPDKVVENKAEEITTEVPVTENIVNEADKAEKVSCSEPVTEAVKEDSVAATEVTNGESNDSSVDAIPTTESIKEVDNNESKEVPTEASDNTTVEKNTEDNKMESEESVPEVESKSKITHEAPDVCPTKPADTNESEQAAKEPVDTESEPKAAIKETLDNVMESEDTTEAEHKDTEVKENNQAPKEENKTVEEENKMESEDSVPQESQAKEVVAETEAISNESKVNETETPKPNVPEPETESKESVSNDVAMETEAPEKVNGNMNGEPEVNQNGDASKDEELNARLSVENGDNDKEMNGANGNGDSSEVEKEQAENKETEILDIKVKTVSTDEPRTDPIEQPVEA